MFVRLALYKLSEGNKLYDKEACLCYQKAEEYHNNALESFRAQGLDSSVRAARSCTTQSMILSSWANVL